MKKITYLSNLLMASFGVYIVWIIYSFFYSWIVLKYPVNSPLGFNVGAAIHPHSTLLLPNIFTMNASLSWKIAYSLETTFIFSLYLFFAANAVRLFWLYSRGIIFDLTCVTLIKRIGISVFSINVLHLLFPAVNTYLLSQQLRHTLHVLFFGTDQVFLFVMSLLLILTAWVMEEGYKMHDEQLHTV